MEILATNKKTKKILITVSGLDGSGKSTQAKLLSEKIVNSKIIHIVNFRLVNRLFSLKKSKTTSNNPKSISKNKWIGYLNIFLLFIDMFIFIIYFKFQTKSIICDRFFYDLIASHAYRYGDSIPLQLLIKFIPKTTISFYILVEDSIAQNREEDDFHDIEYFQKMKFYYSKFYQKYKFCSIKNDSIEKVHESMVHALKTKINKYN